MKAGYDKGSYKGVMRVLQNEGIIGLYRAYMATVFSFGPFSGIYFAVYEEMKNNFGSNEVAFYESMLFSSIAGCIASVSTNPLEIAKVRM